MIVLWLLLHWPVGYACRASCSGHDHCHLLHCPLWVVMAIEIYKGSQNSQEPSFTPSNFNFSSCPISFLKLKGVLWLLIYHVFGNRMSHLSGTHYQTFSSNSRNLCCLAVDKLASVQPHWQGCCVPKPSSKVTLVLWAFYILLSHDMTWYVSVFYYEITHRQWCMFTSGFGELVQRLYIWFFVVFLHITTSGPITTAVK